MTRYTVLVSIEGGLYWRRFASIAAESPQEAVARVAKSNPAYQDRGALFNVQAAEDFEMIDGHGEPWKVVG